MWKATSTGISSRLRAMSLARPTRCGFANEPPGGSKPPTPESKPPTPRSQQPAPGSKQASSEAKTAAPGGAQGAEAVRPRKAPEYIPPAPPPKRRVFGKLLGVTLVGLSGAIGYAWYDESFRDTINSNVPYGKDVLNGIFVYLPDSPSIPAPIMTQKKPGSDAVPKNQDTEQQSFLRPKKSSEPVPATPSPPPPTPVKEEPPVKAEPVVKQAAETAAEKKAREREETRQRLAQKQEEEKAENAALEIILENIMSVCNEKFQKAQEFQEKVVETTNTHKNQLKTAMEDTSKILEKDGQWQSVAIAYEMREEAKRISDQEVAALRQNLEKLRQAVDEGRKNAVTKKNKAIITANETLNKLSSELNKKMAQVSKAESEARIMTKYKDLIEQGRQQFQKELESIVPEVKMGIKKGKKLTEEELNSLIAHAHRRIEQLQKQLAEQIALEQQRLEKALDEKQYEDEKLADRRIDSERDKLAAEIELSKERWNAEAQVQFELELRKQLARQAGAHSQHLQEVLTVREKELLKRFEHQLHGKLIEERSKFSAEIGGWIARLRGIEQAVEARAESEKIAQEAQTLWLACVALNGVLREGNPDAATLEAQLRPLAPEVKAIEEASRNHPFVKAVLFAIPDEALANGVWTEDNLRERFWKVRRVAKRVAMIDETGGSLFRYFLSYFQSFLIYNSVYLKSEADEMEINELDTFQLLNHANYWLQKGDLEQCLKFMNQLKGESRNVAADWIEATRLHLEARQATHTLMAFASARGLGTIF